MSTPPAVDNTTLASLVTVLAQLTAALQAQLAGQLTPTSAAASASANPVGSTAPAPAVVPSTAPGAGPTGNTPTASVITAGTSAPTVPIATADTSAPTVPVATAGTSALTVPVAAINTGAPVPTTIRISTGVHPHVVAAQLSSVSNAHTTFYVVTVGRTPGIYTNVFDANPHVLGVSGATQLRVSTKAEALDVYTRAWVHGNVQTV